MVCRQRGLTLTELMIALAIIAILGAIAIPTYNNYQLRSHRTQAMADLAACAQALERHYTVNFSYRTAAADPDQIPGPPDAALCADSSPADGAARYDISLREASDSSFRLRATPVADSGQAGDGALELLADGSRLWYRDDDQASGAPQDGWAE